MEHNILNNLIHNIKENDFVKEFIEEIDDLIKKEDKTDYWKYKKFMEDDVAATIQISRWSANIKYRDELEKAINESILKISETEGTLYRKKFTPNGPANNFWYSIDKFEKGKIEHINLAGDKVPKGFDKEDILFQYKEDGTTIVRKDLKEKVVEYAIKSVEYLKLKENEAVLEYKKEGHIYKAIDDDGYIFLKDLTLDRGYLIEDIDFVVNFYKGEGKYQLINGEYKKI